MADQAPLSTDTLLRELDPVVTRLQRSIASVPEDHFRRLRQRLDARLGLD